MIEPVSVPILLDVDLSAECELEVDVTTDEYDMDVGMKVVVEEAKIAINGLPPGGSYGDILIKSSDADYVAEWVPPATSPEEDNTRPITAGAVYTEIGNINALLATI